MRRTTMKKDKAVLLVSGGLDSVTLLHFVRNQTSDIHMISVIYGQRHQSKELECAKYWATKYGYSHSLLDISFFGQLVSPVSAMVADSELKPQDKLYDASEVPLTYVPFRNMLFITMAAAVAETNKCNYIYYGAHKGDEEANYWDCTDNFVEKMKDVIYLNPSGIELKAPFARHTKKDIIEFGLLNKVDFSHTWSCYNGNDIACGVCSTCRERILSFDALKEQDPIKYASGNNWSDIVRRASEVKND